MTVTRRIDDLGRIVLPREMREAMNFGEGEALNITSTYDGKIIIEKTQSVSSDDEPKVTMPQDRKMCVIRYDYNDEEVVLLTEEQFRLLDWLSERDFLDGNVNYCKYSGQNIKTI